ncbi:MAG: glucose/arabinose dehydrogenase, partial [Glaciecola sp.]
MASLPVRQARASFRRFSEGLVIVAALGALVVPAAQAQAPAIEYETLTTDVEEPMSITVADDGRVIWTEREGALKVLTLDGEVILAGRLAVSGNQCGACVPDETPQLEEGGLYSILLAKDFNATGRLYLYYSVPGSRVEATQLGVWRLSIFVLDPATNQLDLDSEQPIFEVPAHWDHCCHYGGDLDYLPDGTILLSVGDDIPASSSGGYGPRDNTETWLDGELNVQNPADRRGKILRLMPDGSVPDGSQAGIAPNPFIGQSAFQPYIEPNPIDDPLRPWIRSATGSMIAYDPYVYALGFKQPFKGVVNPYTGHAFYGDVGPDAAANDPTRGPAGIDERNLIPPGGGTNHGWPRCAGPNIPYNDVDWTAETPVDNGLLDCSEMEPAVFYYGAEASQEFPLVGVGGRTGTPSAFYRADTEGALRLPGAFFDDTIIDLEWSRNWFGTFNVTEGVPDTSTFTRWEGLFAPSGQPLLGPIDAAVGPDGAVYIAEYGVGYYTAVGGRIGRVKCLACTPDPADYVVDEGAAAPPEPQPASEGEPEAAPA